MNRSVRIPPLVTTTKRIAPVTDESAQARSKFKHPPSYRYKQPGVVGGVSAQPQVEVTAWVTDEWWGEYVERLG